MWKILPLTCLYVGIKYILMDKRNKDHDIRIDFEAPKL